LQIRSVSVFCGSSNRVPQPYLDEAYRLGQWLGREGVSVFFGGGDFGLMGRLAEGVREAGGTITGIIPRFMVERGWAHPGIEQIVVEDMAVRKRKLIRESDGLIALPGGTGTLEELGEALVSKQLGFIRSPIVIVNTGGFYDDLLRLFERMMEEHFLQPGHRKMWSVVDHAGEVMKVLREAPPWDDRDAGMAKIS